MRKQVVGAFAIAVAATGMMLPAPASATTGSVAGERGYGQIRATGLGYDDCMVVVASGANGNHPTLFDCYQYDDQMWYYPTPGNIGPIVNKYSGQYLTAQGLTPSPAFMYQNTGQPDQQWSAESADSVNGLIVRFRNINSGLCLVIQQSAGAQAMQYDCHNYADQKWYLP
ncbi:RICIN domain-containing protein [Kitasatospora sp. NPDC101183]|uniref:RICIN domain-containing protein n=1 Tax=Kitasatospora sp. NPDC101183 TaxID=3364100 RepID=UPI0038111B9B